MTKYNLLDPHPDVIKSWEDNKFIPDVVTINFNQSRSLVQLGKGKVKVITDPASGQPLQFCIETTEDNERPIERKVTKFYRTADGKMYFIQTLKGQDWQGKTAVEVTQIVGKHKAPVYNGLRDRQTGVTSVTGIRTIKDIYTIPFTAESFLDPSTGERTTLQDLPKAQKVSYFVIANNQKYQCNDIIMDEFLTRPTSDLVYYATHTQQWPVSVEVKTAKKV